MGTLHFAVPRPFDDLVPRALPGTARTWTYASGLAELVCGVLVAVARTRTVGGRLAALLFVAVFPGNVQMALDWRDRSTPEQLIAYARLPLQIPLVWWALRVGSVGSSHVRRAHPRHLR
jgi:uncharacterized membrane protein